MSVLSGLGVLTLLKHFLEYSLIPPPIMFSLTPPCVSLTYQYLNRVPSSFHTSFKFPSAPSQAEYTFHTEITSIYLPLPTVSLLFYLLLCLFSTNSLLSFMQKIRKVSFVYSSVTYPNAFIFSTWIQVCVTYYSFYF